MSKKPESNLENKLVEQPDLKNRLLKLKLKIEEAKQIRPDTPYPDISSPPSPPLLGEELPVTKEEEDK